MSLPEPGRSRLVESVAQGWPVTRWGDLTVVVAVSGGPDSVALLRVLHALRPPRSGRLVAAYFNHGWQPGQALREEAFVRELADQLGLTCHLGRAPAVDTSQSAAGRLPGEEAARKDRYHFLQVTAEQWGARHIVTGHTADDQAETILHRILRGTGLRGLAGIPRVRRVTASLSIVRPLLGIRRSEIQSYLGELRQPYCVDESNRHCRFTRNRLRNQLIPLLQKDYNPEVVAALTRLGELAGEHQHLLEVLVEPLWSAHVRSTASGDVEIDCRPLRDLPSPLVAELARTTWRRVGWPQQGMNHTSWTLLAAMMQDRGPQTSTLPSGVRAARQRERLWLLSPPNPLPA